MYMNRMLYIFILKSIRRGSTAVTIHLKTPLHTNEYD